jgi:hypothetical protein
MKLRRIGIGAIVGSVVVLLIMGICWKGLLGKNEDQNFQIRQAVNGTITIQDRGGYYPQFFNTIWTYPRVQEAFFSASTKEGGTEDDSIRVTFNDGGTAQVSCFVRWQNPAGEQERVDLHRAFSGNHKNIENAVRSALINVCKNTAPLMSASQHQSARKAEFAQLVEEQLRTGIYAMERSKETLHDKFDENGKPITIEVTSIVKDPKTGQPRIAQESPLSKYGLIIQQFSVTGTDYDPQTRKQFEAKKDAFLKAELAKSQKEEEVQKRLQVIEKGLREKAEMEAKMNVEKAEAVIKAEKEKEVSEQQKLQAEIQAEQKFKVAEIEKREAEVKAEKLKAVAEIEKQQASIMLEKAKLDAEAKIELAKAKQKEIELSGAITEETKILAEIVAQRDVKVAEQLSKIAVPSQVIIGGGGKDGEGAGLTKTLFNMYLMEKSGLTTKSTIGKYPNKASK